MALITSLKSLTLDLPPSCIAFCPRRPQLFVVGTYHLHRKEQEGDLYAEETHERPENNAARHEDSTPDEDEDEDDDNPAPESTAPQKRTGSLILFHLGDDNNITHLTTTSTDFAILDIQWTPQRPETSDAEVLAVATSTGLLAFYRLDAACGSSEQHVKEGGGGGLELVSVKTIAEPSTLVLSLAWHPSRANVVGVTLSDGRVCLCESAATIWNVGAELRVSDVHAHSLEAWTLAFNPHERRQILSGGDDIVLQCSHVQEEEADGHQLLWQDRKLHEAGITAILPLSETLVITGSYDDHIRLLSLPHVGRKQCLADLYLGGGVWRLKALPSAAPASASASTRSVSSFPHCMLPEPSHNISLSHTHPTHTSITLLASCMHAGTRIVKLIRDEDEDVWSFEVLARFEEHQSMNYGSDVQPGEDGKEKERRIVSTSFYDRLLCLWEF
ncbi:hypothetical protein M409DRAFT_15859 [Zasmidium cellare ATCC 36951]|uniref:methylated diphthine methylhydrolase n=1 Tax=Zasmidium cellare ATCC 36951 TaxID=1080233 RepID=A0A6A6D2H8_ZASCE|nr:uncharacterized protein M409DRAFT_15859 [Zasmidium cellare ATCC 36951]KAF2173581.1 hypothetical protein M409DRAFT_15859 [Zasmidium cellare ATCC 36951]